MNMIRFVPRVALVVLLLCLSACNLSAISSSPTPPPTAQVQLPTNAPVSTNTPAPTNTPIPPNTQAPPPATPVFNVNQRIPAPACGVTPNVNAANIRSGPGTTFPIIGVLPASHWVKAVRIDAGGWYQVNLPSTPVDGGWISNTVTVLQPPCVCGPNNCTSITTPIPTVPPIATNTAQPPSNICAMSMLNAGDNVPVFSQPTTSQSQWGTLSYGSYVGVVGRTSDGWYAFDPAVAQAPNVGIYRLRWVQTTAKITLTGASCGTLPIIDVGYTETSGQCFVTPANVSNVPIYPQTTYDVGAVGVLSAGATAVVVGQTPTNWYGSPTGWYAVDLGTAQAGNVGRYRLRWIPADSTVQLNGDCSDISANLTLDPF